MDVAKPLKFLEMMNPLLKGKISPLITRFDSIPSERKVILDELRDAISDSLNKNQAANLLYVCTHNSRRSHFGQVAGTLAAAEQHCHHTLSGRSTLRHSSIVEAHGATF